MDPAEGGAGEASPPKKKRAPKAVVPVLDPVQIARRLAEGASLIDALARDIEQEEGPLEQYVVDRFKSMDISHREQCDIALSSLNELRARINQSLAMAAIFSGAVKKMTRALNAAEGTIASVLKEHPDIPYAGDIGNFKLVKNGGTEPLDLDERLDPLVRTIHVGNAVDAGVIFEFDIPAEYLERVELFKLRTDLIRADLQAGKSIPFAKIGDRVTRLGYKAIKVGLQDINTVPLPEEPAQLVEEGES